MKRFCKHRGRIAGIVPVGDEHAGDERGSTARLGWARFHSRSLCGTRLTRASTLRASARWSARYGKDWFFVDRITGVCVCRECDGGHQSLHNIMKQTWLGNAQVPIQFVDMKNSAK